MALSDLPSRLLQEFASEAGSLFVGGGLPLAANLPGWPDFARVLRAKLPQFPNTDNFAEIAQYYEDENDREKLEAEIREMFHQPGFAPGALHEALISIPGVRRIFTTRLDDLLERAAGSKLRPYRKVTNRKAMRVSPDDLNIMKLQGDIYDEDSYVVTTNDFDQYRAHFSQIADLTADEAARKTILFVGFRFNDIDLRTFVPRFSAEEGAERKHYILQPNPSRAVVRALEGRGLNVVPLEVNDDPASIARATCDWLRDFAREIEGMTHRGGETPRRVQMKRTVPSVESTQIFGRARDVEKVLDALRGSKWRAVHISGPSGVGKTSVAAEVGRRALSGRAADAYNNAVWVSANVAGQKIWFDEIVAAVLSEMSPAPAPESFPDRLREANRLLAETRALIIIDGFESIDDPDLNDWLSRLPKKTKLLLTSTQASPEALHQVCTISLQGLELADALDVAAQEAQALGLLQLVQQEKEELRELVKSSAGNPQIIKLALGQVKCGMTVHEVTAAIRSGEVSSFEVAKRSWRKLTPESRDVLLATVLFAGPVRFDGLQAVTGLSDSDMIQATRELVDSRLLEQNPRTGRFTTHSGTRAYANEILKPEALRFAEWKDACIRYLLALVRKNVEREVPKRRYWNALVSDTMCNIDPDWPCIRQALKWVTEDPKRDDDLIEFVMLLVHYMNSRFLNSERLSFVHSALEAVKRKQRYEDEALLRIDALGWTYLEENRLEDADREIAAGLSLVEKHCGSEGRDLRNLGYAWQARLRVEQGRHEDANQLISGGMLVRCSPWIAFRVYMAAGDVAMKQNNFAAALKAYERCNEEAALYGGEGHGYQIEPRLGLACAALEMPDRAVEHFERLRKHDQFAICRMYAEYGLALVAAQGGKKEDAVALAAPVLDQLKNVNSGLLLTLLRDLFEELQNGAQLRPIPVADGPVIPDVPVDLSTTEAPLNPRTKVFISYSRKDRGYLNELLVMLKPLERVGRLSHWSDEQIAPGSDYFGEIQKALSETKVAVLLVSPDFLASDFIHEHELGPILRHANDGGVRMMWIPVRPSPYQFSPLNEKQAVIPPRRTLAEMGRNRERTWVTIAEEIAKAVADSNAATPARPQ